MQHASQAATNLTQPQQSPNFYFVARDFRPFINKSLKGFFTLEIPDVGLVLHQLALHENEGRRWIGLPTKPLNKPDGTRSFLLLVDFRDKKIRNRFYCAALAAIDKMLSEVSGVRHEA